MKFITKKLLCLSCLSCASIGGIAVASNYPTFLGMASATPKTVDVIPLLSAVLDDEPNEIVKTVTIEKNDITYDFEVYNVSKASSNSVYFGLGGFIRNISAINGLSNVSGAVSDGLGFFHLCTGKLNELSNEIELAVDIDDFNTGNPYLCVSNETSFTFCNMGNETVVSKLEFSYSCETGESGLVEYKKYVAYSDEIDTIIGAPEKGSEANPFKIGTPEQLVKLADDVVNVDQMIGKGFILTNDIVFDETTVPFVPIGDADNPFGGYFNGNNHTITANYDAHYNSGLFGSLDYGAVIENLNVDGTIFYKPGSGNIGGICGHVSGADIINCRCNCSILPFEEKGKGKTIDDFNNGKTNDAYYLGGIVGSLEGLSCIEGCTFDGVIKIAEGSSIGGFAGSLFSVDGATISQCIFDGIISINCVNMTFVGGYVGEITGTIDEGIANCDMGDNADFFYCNADDLSEFELVGNEENNYIGFQVGIEW